jgi:hypothetical protein
MKKCRIDLEDEFPVPICYRVRCRSDNLSKIFAPRREGDLYSRKQRIEKYKSEYPFSEQAPFL